MGQSAGGIQALGIMNVSKDKTFAKLRVPMEFTTKSTDITFWNGFLLTG